MRLRFHKYHALLNDFIVFDQREQTIRSHRLGDLARTICDRRSGVGADGIIYLSASRKADRRFVIFNADGSQAEKSGNGLRIAAVHEYRQGRRPKRSTFETIVSVDSVRIIGSKQGVYQVSVDLGEPRFETESIPMRSRKKYALNTPIRVGGVPIPVTSLSVGNPHTILFVSGYDFDWQELGRVIERHRAYPDRTNVEFVQYAGKGKIRVKEWERGAGPTASSGTGAAASVAAGVMLGILDRRCEVVFDVGSLFIEWSSTTNAITLSGPVEQVASGVYDFT